jgi:hypothetical protein
MESIPAEVAAIREMEGRLTPAEAEIAAQLFSGLNVNALATALGSSPRPA